MREIHLANNRGIAFVDNEDFEWLNEYKWHISNGYVITHFYKDEKRISKTLHRLIMKEPENMQIDHVDHNPLNNQKSNLRIVTRSQNSMNRKSQKNSSSIYKGVCWHKRDKKWSVEISVNSKKINLGYFKIEEDAARAYNEAAQKHFGEYAHLNEVIK